VGVGGAYVFTQSSAASTWTIAHNLGVQYVNVEVINSSGYSLNGTYDYPSIQFANVNACILTFTSSVAGYAAVTSGGGSAVVAAYQINAGNAIYTTGTEASPDMQMAMDMAVLSAKRALAFQLGARTSAMMKDYAGQTGTGSDSEVVREIDRVTKSVAADVNVAGYIREKSEIIAEGKNFRAFALLRYPIGDANKIVADQVKKSKVLDTKLKASKAFQDLEQEIESARKR
jgi:hypothetical protein